MNQIVITFVCIIALIAVTMMTCSVAAAVSSSSSSSFQVYRNVKDYGAVGDGVHDDTAAFITALTENKATSVGAEGAPPSSSSSSNWNTSKYNPQTTKPSFVQVPSGKYLITASLPLTYYTQLVGNFTQRPTLLFRGSASSFSTSGANYCLDAGSDMGPAGWFTASSTNNFFHQVRNLIVDASGAECTVVHWMVSQACSLDHVDIIVGQNQVGVFMESGSATAPITNVRISGGFSIALKLGNQQASLRNISIAGQWANGQTGIFIIWGWQWSLFDIHIQNVSTGIRLGNGLASAAIVDTLVDGASYTAFSMPSSTQAQFENVATLHQARALQVYSTDGTHKTYHDFPGGASSGSWANLRLSSAPSGMFQGAFTPVKRTPMLARRRSSSESEIQQHLPLAMYIGAMRPACLNDDSDSSSSDVVVAKLVNGTDVTSTLQDQITSAAAQNKTLLIKYGVYFVSDTVLVPEGSRIFGQVWSRIVARGSKFQDSSSPRAVFQIGAKKNGGKKMKQTTNSNAQQSSRPTYLADLLFTNQGPVPGAVLVEWNVDSGSAPPGAAPSGLWSVHVRVGGASGTLQDPANCPTTTTRAKSPLCDGVHTAMRITQGAAGVYMEESWLWVADHDIDSPTSTQLNIYSTRGFVSTTTSGPLWMYGVASEHSILFQFAFGKSASNVLISLLQTETPYYQPEFPLSTIAAAPSDPPLLAGPNTTHALAVAVASPLSFFVSYGVGVFSFFDRWSTKKCGAKVTEPCQKLLVAVYGGASAAESLSTVQLSLINAHGAADTAMLWKQVVPATATENGFCSTTSFWGFK